MELIRRSIETFNRGDPGGAIALLDLPPEFEFEASEALEDAGRRGPEDFRRATEAFWGEFDDPYIEVHALIDAGDRTIVSATFQGRGKHSGVATSWGPLWGVWTVRNGRMVRWQGFTDRGAALEAAGLRASAMSQEDVEVVRALFDAYREQDVDTVLEMVDPDIEVRPSIAGGPEGTVYRGLDGFRQFLANVEAAWADFRIETEEFRHLGNTVLVLGRSFARGDGSGVLVEANTGWVCVVRQGKVHRFQSFTSREEALEAVGLRE